MATAAQFKSMGISIFASQDREIILGKQPVLSEYGSSVRAAINKLPPEASKELLAGYGAPTPFVIKSIKDTILQREFAIENAAKGVNLDQEWARDGAARRMDEVGLSDTDPWITPEP